MFEQNWFWIFNLCIAIIIALDLLVFHRKSHVVSIKEALWSSAFWIVFAMIFNLFVYYFKGSEGALNFLTGYLVEKALSVDNLFVFLLIFSYFRVPGHLLHKVLFWGIFGAIIMRAIFILFGIALIQNFHWVIYIFGLFLVITGIKLALEKGKEIHPEKNFIIRNFEKFFSVSPHFVEDKFFIKQNGRYLATPLFIVLLAIETTDVIFAIDSIPAIIGITEDPFIVYTSNILAILGLRSLYFALSHILALFHYLHYGLALILVFIGCKMLISGYITIPILLSLGIIILILFLSILLSVINPRKL